MSAEFVARMEDVLDLYAEPYDPQRPVVCFDETSKQLVAEKRAPIPAKAGRRELRNGRNLFMTLSRLEARGSDRASHHGRLRPSDALAGGCCLPGSGEDPSGLGTRLPVRGLRAKGSQTGDPTAGVSLYSLNMAEIEFSVFSNQCLNRRIEDEVSLKREIAALEIGVIRLWQPSTGASPSPMPSISFGVSILGDAVLGRGFSTGSL